MGPPLGWALRWADGATTTSAASRTGAAKRADFIREFYSRGPATDDYSVASSTERSRSQAGHAIARPARGIVDVKNTCVRFSLITRTVLIISRQNGQRAGSTIV